VCAILFNLIGNKLKGSSHAIFDHLLFGLFGLLKFFQQNGYNFREGLFVLKLWQERLLYLLFMFIGIFYQKFD
jgi:di/tricarboxylate transporter